MVFSLPRDHQLKLMGQHSSHVGIITAGGSQGRKLLYIFVHQPWDSHAREVEEEKLQKCLPLQPQQNTSSLSTSPISAAGPPGVCQQSTVVWQVIHVVAVANGTSSAGLETVWSALQEFSLQTVYNI